MLLFQVHYYGIPCTPGRKDLPDLWKWDLKKLAKRWLPILNVFDENDVDVCYEIHPGEDLHDGDTFERFFKRNR